MTWHFKQDEELEKLLSESKQDFQFDQQNVKAKLFMAIESRPKNVEVPRAHLHFLPKYATGLVLALILVGGTAGLAIASNKAKPGETLYSVQKFQNHVVLSLPISDDSKAQYRTDIAAQRLEELDQIEPAKTNPTQIQAELQASQESINDAVDNVSQIQAQAKSNNKKILSIVKQLSDITDKHEKQMENMQKNVTDEKLKKQIENSLEQIRETRAKLQKEND